MRIGLDASALYSGPSGVGTYTLNLLSHLKQAPGDTIIPFSQCRANGARPALPTSIWMQCLLPGQLARSSIDVCHFTNNVATLASPCPSVVTIHDMTLWLFPQHHPRRRLLTMRPLIPLAARRADAIVTVSHSAKKDIVRLLRVPEDKVRVIAEAPAPCFKPITGRQLEDARRRLGLPRRFFLYVGTIEPRKNLVRLLEAMGRLRASTREFPPLLVVGPRGWRDHAIFAAVDRLDLGGGVRFLGQVSTDTLVLIYNLAEALVFPSLYEGFGLPVVEAMACGTPVITSRRGSLPETAGDAAEFVNPSEVEDIAHAMQMLAADTERRAELRARGLSQAAQFTWVKAASLTREVYAEVTHQGTAHGFVAAASAG
jgi:glycosyltransferase involved in cell wall biosynthesis